MKNFCRRLCYYSVLIDLTFQHAFPSFWFLQVGVLNIFNVYIYKHQCSRQFAWLHLHANCTTPLLQIQSPQWDWQKAKPEGSVSNSVMMCKLIRLLCLSLSLVFAHKAYGNPS